MRGSIKSIHLGIGMAARRRFTGRTIPRMALALAVFLGCLMVAASGDVPESRAVVIDVRSAELLTSPPGENWPSYNGDFTGRRFSSLSQINLTNVAQLRPQWGFHSGNSDRLEVTPLVVNGVMFVTSANDTYTLDARTGLVIWHHALPISKGLADFGASPMSYAVLDRQYVAVAAGSDIFSFALP
jgi:glucose dehydrogenase